MTLAMTYGINGLPATLVGALIFLAGIVVGFNIGEWWASR